MFKTRSFCSGLLLVFAVTFLCVTSYAQVNEPQSREDHYAPFASVNETLSRAADSTLSRSVETRTMQLGVPDEHAVPKSSSSVLVGSDLNSQTLIKSILAREGVPVELSAVVQVESSGNRFALSPKGARGLWQLMPDTARRYGLQVNSQTDERIDVDKSTIAAAKYLHDLYAQFGSWPLALAAYNTGESYLQRAIHRAQSNQFAALCFLKVIPAETRSYVPAVLANITRFPLSGRSLPADSRPANLIYAGTASLQEASARDKSQ